MILDTDLERCILVAVRMLRASSAIGKPGIEVPKGTLSVVSSPGEYITDALGEYGALPLIWDGRSYSVVYTGSSEYAGVNETTGGAACVGAAPRGMGLSDAIVLPEKLDELVCVAVYDGRRALDALDVGALVLLVVVALEGVAVVLDKGAANVFFIREKRDVTMVYEDWSCSSSSEKGLKEVRLVISSLVLPFDRDDCAVNDPVSGGVELGESMSVGQRVY